MLAVRAELYYINPGNTVLAVRAELYSTGHTHAVDSQSRVRAQKQYSSTSNSSSRRITFAGTQLDNTYSDSATKHTVHSTVRARIKTTALQCYTAPELH